MYQMPDNFPRLSSYEDAKDWYENTRPMVRGEFKGIRPLGANRRYVNRSKIMECSRQNEAGELIKGYACKFWNTDIITFYADGRVYLDTGGWDCPTTFATLENILGNCIHRYEGKIYYVDRGNNSMIIRRKGIDDGGLWLDSNRAVLNPKVEYKHALNRQALKEHRARLEPFIKYCLGILSLSPSMGNEELGAAYAKAIAVNDALLCPRIPPIMPNSPKAQRGTDKIKADRELFFQRAKEFIESNNLDGLYTLYVIAHGNLAELKWENASYHGYIYTLTKDRFKKRFTELIKYEYANELFNREPQPIGKVVSDSNKKYFY